MSVFKLISVTGFFRFAGISVLGLCMMTFPGGEAGAQDYEHHENIDGAVIYDHAPSTKIGDDIFGDIIADFCEPVNGEQRCSHGGPVCMEYADGTVVVFYANTSSHNVDGWSEYAISRDKGKTWDKYHPSPYHLQYIKRTRNARCG